VTYRVIPTKREKSIYDNQKNWLNLNETETASKIRMIQRRIWV